MTEGKPHKSALDELPPKQLCAQSGCHAEVGAKVARGTHKDSECSTCHGDIHGKFVRTNWNACKGCHGDQVAQFKTSIHGTAAKQVRCIDCHGDLHDPKAHKDPMAPMSKVLQVTTCGECHDTEYVRAFRTSVHGQGLLRSGLAVAPTCSTCHGAHDIAKVKSETSKVAKVNSVETCGQCHEFIVTRWKESTHGQKWLADKDPARVKRGAEPETPTAERPKTYPVCIDCHSGHKTFDPMVYANNLKMADTCGACHEEASRTYRESFHGKATRLGQAAAATCADCHTPHYMLPATDPRSTVQPREPGRDLRPLPRGRERRVPQVRRPRQPGQQGAQRQGVLDLQVHDPAPLRGHGLLRPARGPVAAARRSSRRCATSCPTARSRASRGCAASGRSTSASTSPSC